MEEKKYSIAELEAILQRDDEVELEILPNGQVVEKGSGLLSDKKPLTFRDNLGGEYAEAA